MDTGVRIQMGTLTLVGCLTGSLWGGVVSRARGSAAKRVALGAFWGAVGGYMLDLFRKDQLLWDTDGQRVHDMLGYLSTHLGEGVTAYLSGIEDPGLFRAWIDGSAHPGPEEISRLEIAYEAAQCLVKVCGDEMTQSWFFGTNPSLGDRAPAYVLRHWSLEDRTFVLAAAQEFAEL